MLQSGLRQLAGSSGGVSNGVDGRLLSRTRSSSRASGRLDTLTCPAVAWNSDGAIEAIRGEIEQVGRDADSLMAKLTVSMGVWSGARRFDDDAAQPFAETLYRSKHEGRIRGGGNHRRTNR